LVNCHGLDRLRVAVVVSATPFKTLSLGQQGPDPGHILLARPTRHERSSLTWMTTRPVRTPHDAIIGTPAAPCQSQDGRALEQDPWQSPISARLPAVWLLSCWTTNATRRHHACTCTQLTLTAIGPKTDQLLCSAWQDGTRPHHRGAEL